MKEKKPIKDRWRGNALWHQEAYREELEKLQKEVKAYLAKMDKNELPSPLELEDRVKTARHHYTYANHIFSFLKDIEEGRDPWPRIEDE